MEIISNMGRRPENLHHLILIFSRSLMSSSIQLRWKARSNMHWMKIRPGQEVWDDLFIPGEERHQDIGH